MSTTIRYTKGFLLDFKRRLGFIESAHDLLEVKRDHLMREIKENLEKLKRVRKKVVEEVMEINRNFALLHAAYGSSEIKTAAAFLEEKARVTVIPRSILGVVVPLVKEINTPSLKTKYPLYITPLAEKISNVLSDLVRLAELEAEIEFILEDLRTTSTRVNALERVVIPRYKMVIKRIQDVLDHEMLQEFMRIKLVKRMLSRRGGAWT
ncbi:MAG: V-type ATP synthase subunit D [Aigarchaeota archaeon]|nr:V-type ATP synthase subunit D [Aigarchaeota archaeon]MDW8021587.1 V-type ATP synthase subunit D [Nitrososphaerota archaeon]